MKKIVLMFTLALIMQAKVYPEFEINFTVPMGVGFVLPNVEGTQLKQDFPHSINYEHLDENGVGISTGVFMQIGNNFKIKNKVGLTSISLLADIGYSLEAFLILFDEPYYSYNNNVIEDMTLLNTINLGVIPKLNFYLPNLKIPFSVGLGGGVKIPFSGKRYLSMSSGKYIYEDLKYQDIRKSFEYPFIPYIKLTYDTYFYVSKKVAFTFGSYISYDFGMQYDTDKLNADSTPPLHWMSKKLELTEYSYSSLTIGFSFGISFGKSDPRPKE